MKKILLTVIVLLIFSSVAVAKSTQAASDWKYVDAGAKLMKQGKCTEAIVQFKKATNISAKASTYRSMATCYEKLSQYQNAADTLYLEAALHKKMGQTNTYLATLDKANKLNSEVETYIEVEKTETKALAKYEPASGVYIGAYIEQDAIIKQAGNRFKNFNSTFGKQHAMYYNYHNYGTAFPAQTAELLKEAGAAFQISLEPNQGLAEVKDDQYLRQFARDAKASGIPIFLRFASEMNGDWVRWTGNPDLYKQKFQLVAKVMKEEAPNVAMVWVPNSVPSHNIDPYYPGDAAVDWVGMNLYSVPFANGDKSQPADSVNPLDYLDVVYDKYSSRKPMMIAEFAASHFSAADGKDKTAFNQNKMHLFYEGVMLKYPRVKSINWFSVDTLTATWVNPSRRLNNFSLTVNPTVKSTYASIINNPYYLSSVVNGPNVETVKSGSAADLLNGTTVHEDVNGLTYAKIYDPYISKVVYKLNSKVLSESKTFPYKFTIPNNKLSASNTLTTIVYDSKGKVAFTKTTKFNKGIQLGTLKENQVLLKLNEKHAYTSKGATALTEAPFVKDGRTYVPLRFISETLGADVNYTAATKSVNIVKGVQSIMMTIGSKTAKQSEKTIILDAAPLSKNGTTFVPLRVVTSTLGGKIMFDKTTQTITLDK